MPFKTILIVCDAAAKATASRIDLAVKLAALSGGHLVGLYIRPPFEPFVGFANTSFDMEYFQRQCRAKMNADGEAAATSFYGLTGHMRPAAEWRAIDFTPEAVAEEARTADLVVVGQADPENPVAGIAADLPASLALDCGKAVLVVPWFGAPAAPAKTILLCWNNSREAARAAAEALPFLQAAEKVVVLTIGEAADAATPAASTEKAAAWLARHGVTATLRHHDGRDSDAGPLIVAAAKDAGADLIVMGAYGHSRLRELLLGGASRSVLADMPVPVLMAH